MSANEVQSPAQNLHLTAYHEAGHAVIAFWAGSRFHHVSVVPDEATQSRGRLSYQPVGEIKLEIDPTDERPVPFWWLLRSVAGSVAVEIAIGGRANRGYGGDYKQFAHYVRRVPREDLVSWFGVTDERIAACAAVIDDGELDPKTFLAWRRSADFVRHLFRSKHLWSAVETLAAALIEQPYIAYDEAERLYQQCKESSHGEAVEPGVSGTTANAWESGQAG